VFAASDIFIMPSLVEGFGLVYVEALAQGCHVIGTANTGLPDLHLDDGAHSLVEPGNIAALSEIISKTQARAEAGEFDRSAIIKAGHAWTHTHFRQAIAEHAAQVLRDFNA
jgi:glycosyltransferase involved in cell wall biosynthesis